MAFIGYARVSAVDQDYDGQIERLEQAGCGRIYAEKMSGKSQNGRHELHKALRGLLVHAIAINGADYEVVKLGDGLEQAVAFRIEDQP
jgi:resolvase-like protein